MLSWVRQEKFGALRQLSWIAESKVQVMPGLQVHRTSMLLGYAILHLNS